MTQSPRFGCKPYIKLPIVKPGIKIPAGRPVSSWTVPRLCAAYDRPSGMPGGGVIVIVELGGGWTATDVADYFKALGQPVPSITDVSVDGTKNAPNQRG